MCYTRGTAIGPGLRCAAFEEVLWSLTKEQKMWKLHGSWFVPDVSPVCDEERWYSIGTLLAIALLTNGSIHPVSPVLIYTLMVASFRKPRLTDIQTTMNFSLNYIRELDELQSRVVLPWMVVPPGQDWRDLPAGH